MRWLSFGCLVVFLITQGAAWPNDAALAADPSSIEAFAGSWQGRSSQAADNALPPEGLGLELEEDADGFHMSWPDLGAVDQGRVGVDDIDASFSATDRAGVYEYVQKPGSMLTRMFASPKTGNPLKGETLLWARIDGPTLAVYSMRIDMKGGFDLDRYRWTRTADGLNLTFTKRTQASDAEMELQGELAAAGR